MARGDLHFAFVVPLPPPTGSLGLGLSFAFDVPDPLDTPVPGDYAPGTAGWAITQLLGPGRVVVEAPTVAAHRLTGLIAGDDYTADGRGELLFLVGGAPSLAGAELSMTLQHEQWLGSGQMITAAGRLVSDGDPKQVAVALPGALTNGLHGEFRYALVAEGVGVGARRLTLARGEAHIKHELG